MSTGDDGSGNDRRKKTRRAQGEGSMYWREDRQRWVVEFDHGWVAGRRKRTLRTFKTQKEALRHLTDMRKVLLDGLPASDQRMRVGAFLEYWLDEVVEPSGRKPATKASYRDNVKLHIEPALAQLRLAQLRHEDVQRFINRKRTQGYSASTMRTLMVILRMALDHAVVMEKVSRNVAAGVQVPKALTERREVRAWTRGEGLRFLSAAKQTPLFSLYLLLAMVGLRRGEALALRWDDVDLDDENPVLRVERQVQRLRGVRGLVVGPPKSKSARRRIALPRYCVQVLKTHRDQQEEQRRKLGEAWTDFGLIFPTAVGTYIEPGNLNRHMRAVCRRAGLDPRGVHTLRHTAATMARALGVDWKEIQAMLGHADVGMTMNVYVDMIPDLQREAADLIDEGFGRAEAEDQDDDQKDDGDA